MLIVIGIALTSALLLLSVRVGTRSSLPVAVFSGLAAFFLLGPSFGLAPLMGWAAVYQMERGAGFGKALAELALGLSSRSIDILNNRPKPNRGLPDWITEIGVRMTTKYRFIRAGKET